MPEEPEVENQESIEEEQEGGPVKSFLEHLEDLRWTLIKSAVSLAIGMILCLVAAPQLVEWLTRPVSELVEEGDLNLNILSPAGGFMIALRLAFYGGLLLSLPFILFFIGQFVVPALRRHEKKYFLGAFAIGGGLFVAGVLLCYFVFLDISLRAFMQYNKWLNLGTDLFRAEDYFLFVARFMLAMGLSFELPVLILTLVKLDLLQHENLIRGRKYMFVFNLVLAAVVTPQDILTTLLMVLPLQVLFEIAIWISAYWHYREKKRAAALGLDEAYSDEGQL